MPLLFIYVASTSVYASGRNPSISPLPCKPFPALCFGEPNNDLRNFGFTSFFHDMKNSDQESVSNGNNRFPGAWQL